MEQIDNKRCEKSRDTLTMAVCMDSSVHIDALPDEMLEFILTYLPPYKDLECCRLVCRRWNEIVKNLIRRSKLNLHKGLLDFRLRWEVFSPRTVLATSADSGKFCSNLPGRIIAGRFSHSAVCYGNSMYVFGGGSSSDTTFNDLWRFDLSEMCWERPLSMGSYPSPKGSASMVCWRNQLVLFGGWRYPSLHPPYQPWCLFDELHYYDLDKHRWIVHTSVPSPPPMAGHSASVHGDRMVIFGGYQIADGVNSNTNETWCLNMNEHRWWQPRLAGNVKPPCRYGQFQLALDDKHLLIVGGCGGPNSIYTDAWLLDMSEDLWIWRSIPVRNKKFGASHMWCNPACKIGSKLVVLGPTPNMPQDLQMMMVKHMRPVGRAPVAVGQYNRNHQFDRPAAGGVRVEGDGVGVGNGAVRYALHNNRNDNLRLGGVRDGPDDQYFANRRAILNQHQQNANNNLLNNNQWQPRTGRLSELHATASPTAATEESNQNRPSCSSAVGALRVNGASTATRNDNEAPTSSRSGGSHNPSDIEAANRLQRNLALRCRENEPRLPKRFDELYEDPFRMAAFNVQNRPRSLSRDHSERIRRMEEKMNAIRNSRRNAVPEQKSIKEPSPKRVKRNVLSLFVCDLSSALDRHDPHLQWLEYKNYGIIPGAPERLILSTMVAGHGELILFGGVHKETLSEITHQVSNSVHFLSAPHDVV